MVSSLYRRTAFVRSDFRVFLAHVQQTRPESGRPLIAFLIVLVPNLQMDYLRTSQLETLEGSIGRIQVSILGMLYIVLTRVPVDV